MTGERPKKPDRRGRVEMALDQDLIGRKDLDRALRGLLRAQARAVDVAEAARDPGQVSVANRVYLDSLKVAGLVPIVGQPVDAVDAFLAGLLRATPGGGDPPPR